MACSTLHEQKTTKNLVFDMLFFVCEFSIKIFHVEDVIEATGYVLEKDSEYCQKFLEEEEEVVINVTTKGGGTTKYQVK